MAQRGSNISALQKNVERRTGSAGKSSAADAKGSARETRFLIDDLFVNATKVNLLASVLQDKTQSAILPDIHLQNLGKGSGGATAAAVAEKVLRLIAQKATKAAIKEMGERQV